MWITGLKTFLGAKIIHLLIACLIPALVIKITHVLTGNREEAILAGSLVIFPVFYNIFLGTTDSFAVTMLLGGSFYLLTKAKGNLWVFLGLGAIAGLMHLTRADGFFWILPAGYLALKSGEQKIRSLILIVIGYSIFMGPWFIRNQLVLDQIMPAGASNTFWLKEYNQLFSYQTSQLTFKSWISQGLSGISKNIFDAALVNVKTAFLVQGQVILAPFVVIGAGKYWRDTGLQALALVWAAIFLLMTVVFPFDGMRGGYLHSSAALQPLIWGLASGGFFSVIEWGVSKRDWQKVKAGNVFGAALVMLVALASIFIFYSRVIGEDRANPIWNQSHLRALAIDDYLTDQGLAKDDPVMINNPPGLFSAAERSAVAIPSEGIEAVVLAGQQFEIHYLVLEENHPAALHDLYLQPDSAGPFELVGSVEQALIFRLPVEGADDD
jgi:hypothetical protein